MEKILQRLAKLPTHSFNTGYDNVLQFSLQRKIQREHVVLKDDITIPTFDPREEVDQNIVWDIRKVLRFTNADIGDKDTVSPQEAVEFAEQRGGTCFCERVLFQLLASYDHPVFKGVTIFPFAADEAGERSVYHVAGTRDVSVVRVAPNAPHGKCVTWAFIV